MRENSNRHIALLEKMLTDEKQQDAIYRPTNFWQKASEPIVNDLKQEGFDHFRSLPSTRGFFVPTYGYPGNSFTTEELNLINGMFDEITEAGSKKHQYLTHLISGEMWALSDYRTYIAANNANTHPSTLEFSESKVGKPSEHFNFENKWFSRSSLNYLNGLSFLKQHIDTTQIGNVLEIGGGFGTLGEILNQAEISYVNVDIPPTAAVSSFYLSQAINTKLYDYLDTNEMDQIEMPTDASQYVLCPWQLEKLNGTVDLFVNFISFQEMEPNVVKNYIFHVDRLKANYVLLRNIKEGKAKKSAEITYGVETPILGSDYDDFLSNYQLVATNIFPFGYKTLDGFHSELRLYKRKVA